jgi:hypothetical protein
VPPNEIEAKNEVQWAQYINFCQKKLNEKTIYSKSNTNAPPKFEIESAVDAIPSKMSEPKKEEAKKAEEVKKPDEKAIESKKEEPAKSLSPSPEKMKDGTPNEKAGEEADEGDDNYDDYIKNLEKNAQ